MKYTVGENTSFIANSRIYGPGEEIDSSFFKFPKTIEAAVAAGKLKPVQDNPPPAGSGDPPAGDDAPAGGGNTNDTGLTPKKRKSMEKAAIDSGLRNPEEVKNLSDKDLVKLLTDAGVVA
jgi:hypothetical protein